jgi:hypothetical protein
VVLYRKILLDKVVYGETIPKALKQLLESMLQKSPTKRISIEKIRKNAWVTGDGKFPLMSKEENCFLAMEEVEVTEQDIQEALVPVMVSMMDVLNEGSPRKATEANMRKH